MKMNPVVNFSVAESPQSQSPTCYPRFPYNENYPNIYVEFHLSPQCSRYVALARVDHSIVTMRINPHLHRCSNTHHSLITSATLFPPDATARPAGQLANWLLQPVPKYLLRHPSVSARHHTEYTHFLTYEHITNLL